MTIKEAIEVLTANVMVACDRAQFSGACKAMVENALDMAIAALENNVNWISVKDKLPPEGEIAILSIADDSGDSVYRYTSVGWYSGYDYKFVVDNEYCYYVTHWMPLPEPPKGE